jgi:hypothetical protein
LGRERFLAKYGFGKAREYFVFHEGRHYDSKAIAGVAYGYEHPNEGPLSADSFSGGENTVRKALQQLGFTVVKRVPEHRELGALVLVENEVTVGGEYDFWADDTGARYQFPNQYRNRVRPGVPFVYYRGVRRADGRRGAAEYFGTGVIGEVWPDPEQPSDTPPRHRRWFCAIEEYRPFRVPLPAKRSGKPYENIKTAMGWRTGVREIPVVVFNELLEAAGAATKGQQWPRTPVEDATITETEAADVLVRRPRSASRAGLGLRRPSRELKQIGDWAEELVYRWLFEKLEPAERDTLDWVAQRGETPGWDISYRATSGAHIHVEVKATKLGRFSGIDVTGNEWQAATSAGETYVLALVTKAMSSEPSVALVWNPAKHVADNALGIEPTGYRLIARDDA